MYGIAKKIATTIAESTTLKDGISCFDALTVMAAAAQTQGEELDDSSASVDGATLSTNVTHFHLTAHYGDHLWDDMCSSGWNVR